MDELTLKFEENNNFQLKIKSIQITDKDLILKVKDYLLAKNKTVCIIEDNYYDRMLEAYNNKIDYVLIDQNINFMLPIVTIITKDITDIIKPTIPVIYMLKDNKIIQNVKTKCNKTYTSYQSAKTLDDLYRLLDTLL